MAFDFFQATKLFVSQDLAYFHNDKHRKLIDKASTSQPSRRGKEIQRKHTDDMASTSQQSKRPKVDPSDRTLLVRRLNMHTMKPKIYDYFETTMKENVEKISFNSWKNKYYNNSCLVVMDSVGAACRVMQRPSHEHIIDDCRVLVQYFLGEENHPEVFQGGEHVLSVDRLNGLYYSHKLIEDEIVKNGTYSSINWIRDPQDGSVTGEAMVRFYEETDREKARDAIRRNLTHRVSYVNE